MGMLVHLHVNQSLDYNHYSRGLM